MSRTGTGAFIATEQVPAQVQAHLQLQEQVPAPVQVHVLVPVKVHVTVAGTTTSTGRKSTETGAIQGSGTGIAYKTDTYPLQK